MYVCICVYNIHTRTFQCVCTAFAAQKRTEHTRTPTGARTHTTRPQKETKKLERNVKTSFWEN